MPKHFLHSLARKARRGGELQLALFHSSTVRIRKNLEHLCSRSKKFVYSRDSHSSTQAHNSSLLSLVVVVIPVGMSVLEFLGRGCPHAAHRDLEVQGLAG